MPPPAPGACFGRDDLIDEVVTLAESLTPVALIGAGGIGKTSIALTVLHHDRVKQQFGENRRFIRCDQFPATLNHLLNRLSEVIGAGIKSPKDLTPLRPFMSSNMIMVLDNAESILDPEGPDAGEIYDLVEELSELPTLCLCITSRISTVPHECKTIEVPVLSMDAACQAFYHIYKLEKESDLANEILEQLEFHPLSITLLATVGHQNKWKMERLKGEWDKRRTSVLQTRHKKSFAVVIELSLTSPMFQEFGPDARGLLGVVAFFPQGVDENNIDWLFPTISNRIDIFDGLCVLSLTSRSNGFITMLAPLRDYLSPDDPRLSPLLCAAKDRYFIRMSVYPDPDKSDSKEIRWIASEDANVEHLIDVFATIDANSDDIWEACDKFMAHLYWHKPRLTFLAPKIQWLPDNHCYKSGYLVELSMFLGSIGNDIDCKKLLNRALKPEREQGSDVGVARILSHLCDASRHMGLYDEGAQQARDGLEIYESLGNKEGQAQCLIQLAWFSLEQEQLGAAEEAASRAMNLLPETGDQFFVCNSHHILGLIYRSKGEIEKAVHHLEAALAIASSFDWRGQLFDIHFSLATLFCDEGKLDSAHIHAERTKLYAVNNPYGLGKAMIQQAAVWWRQYKLEETSSEVLRAAEIFEKLGSSWGMRVCGEILEHIQKGRDGLVDSGQLREFLHTMPLPGVLFSNLRSRNRTKALTTESNLRDATSRYPVLSHRLPQRSSIQLQITYVPSFVYLLYLYTSSFALSRCSSLALNIDPLSASSSPALFTSYLCIPQNMTPNVLFQQYYNLQEIPSRMVR